MPNATLSARLRALCIILLGHAGWRPERRNLGWAAALVLSFALALGLEALDDPPTTVMWFIAVWVFYYVGLALLVGQRRRERQLREHGEEEAFARFEPIVGVMFLNQGLAVGAMSALSDPALALPLSSELARPLGVALCVLGLGIKVWATALVGLDVYYYKDLFLGRPIGPLVQTGPYRFFSHPMYGPGHLHAYGFALLAGSTAGLVAAAICQLSIYGFCLWVEGPFVQRLKCDAPALAFAPLSIPSTQERP
jgi:protein-S-isoprenylcysteine O-methyltransferase Ste14